MTETPAWPAWIPARGDGAIAAACFVALGLPVLIGGPPQLPGVDLPLSTQMHAPVAATLACIVMPAAIAYRRIVPAISMVIIYLAALAHFLAGIHLLPVDVLILFSLFSVVLHGSLLSQVLGIVGAYLGAAIISVWSVTFAFATPNPIYGLYAFLGGGGAVTLIWAMALSRRTRQRELTSLEEVNATLQAEREQASALAATNERTRIAREMHDIVAHSLSVIIAQADGARYVAS
ncbi:MAG: histidine kinase dimerization/phosphoacceptor domain-containing protein, partial [Bowdeniella nasicola]|nr:histidine kinase dimerization/phosphoacceptor domain-containing protein [Bowdeniella nasicola]